MRRVLSLLIWSTTASTTTCFLVPTPVAPKPNHTIFAASSTEPSSTNMPYIKNCIVEVQPDRAQEFADICRVAQAKSLQEEPGCLRLDILQITDEEGNAIPNKFIVYEIFQDEAAYQLHTKQPYTAPIGKFLQTGGLVHEDAYVAQSLCLSSN